MVAAPSMLHIAGKTLKEACVTHAIPAGHAIVTRSCLVHFCTTFLYYIWTDLALELKLHLLLLLISTEEFSRAHVHIVNKMADIATFQ